MNYTRTEDEIKAEYKILEQISQKPEKFAYFYEKYYGQIFKYILRRCASEMTTADLTQQTFLKAMLNIHKFVPKGLPFSAWLYRIAANEVNQYYRQNKLDFKYSWEDNLLNNIVAEVEDADDEHLGNKLTQALEKLKEDELHIIQLRFYEDKSFKEIGFILDITEANAKMKLYRLLEKMKKKHF